MDFLLAHRKTLQTGKKIAQVLGIDFGITFPENAAIDNLIRWGNSERLPKKPSGRVLNTRTAIQKVTEKDAALFYFKEVGILVPLSAPLTLEVARVFPYPALARLKNHQQGRDIKLCLQINDAINAHNEGKEYLVEYIPTSVEYRIHVFDDEIIKCSEKVLVPNTTKHVVPWIRNYDHGYIYKVPQLKPTAPVKSAAIDAIKVAGLIFGAVDIIVSDPGIPYILEVNTAPGLINSGIILYANKFAELLGIPTIYPDKLEPETQENGEEDESPVED